MSGYICDTETTKAEDGEIIELAYGKVTYDLDYVGAPYCQRFRPKYKISMGAMAVHHIIPAELMDCPPSAEARLPDDCQYLIGHNIDFDWKMLGSPPGVKHICTLAFARSKWPKEEGHTLGACIYRIMGDFAAAREMLRDAHSAGKDIQLVQELLDHMLCEHYPDVQNLEELWQECERARVPTVWSFGKFKGQPIEAADRGYLSWCLRQPDMDEYVKIACRNAL